MWVKEGRTKLMDFIKRAFANSSPSWSSPFFYLVTQSVSESESHTYSTLAGWSTQTLLGYLTGSNPFTNAVADVAGVPTLTGNEITWTNTTGSSQTVYGWASTFYDGTSNLLLNYKAFPSSTVVAAGATFKFTPAFDSTSP